MPDSANNARLLHLAILWATGKEDMDKKSYRENLLTEVCFYGDGCAIINNTAEEPTTVFFGGNGSPETIAKKSNEVLWK